MIEVVVAKEVQIDLRQDIDAGILSIAVAKDKDGRINHQKADNNRNGVLVVAEQGEQRHDAIANGDALHDGPDAKVSKAQEIALDGMIEPVDKEADDEQQYRTLDDATDDLRGGLELGLHQGKITRDSHDEKEEGEHKVAGGHAVPLRMFQHFERLSPAIIHEDHSCHSNSAQNVET